MASTRAQSDRPTAGRARRRWRLRHGDCLAAMAKLPTSSVDAVVCDPPYGLNFMGKQWDRPMAEHVPQSGAGSTSNAGGRHDEGYRNMRDSERHMQAWHEAWAREALRVLKPGGHLLAFGGTRTFHRLTCGLEDAGFEIRDCLCWLYGQGFPKSLDVGKAIDKAAGAKRTVVGRRHDGVGNTAASIHRREGWAKKRASSYDVTAPSSRQAHRWQGWGTALRPAWDPIVLARKPLEGTVARTVCTHGTGALNIDECRIGFCDHADEQSSKTKNLHTDLKSKARANHVYGDDERACRDRDGRDAPRRWPANAALSHTEDCRQVGHSRLRSNGHHPAARRSGGLSTNGHKGQDGLRERSTAGELVRRWECSADCPVRMLDEQSRDVGNTLTRHPRHRLCTGRPRASRGMFSAAAVTSATPRMRTARESHASSSARRHRAASATQDSRSSRGARRRSGNPAAGSPQAGSAPHARWRTYTHGQADRPDALPQRLVTPPGGVVLDPFAGSGTTGIAAACRADLHRDPARSPVREIARARIKHWAASNH